jgi:hypothetical protein
MKAISHFLAVLLALALLAATGFGAYLGLEFLTAAFAGAAMWVQLVALASAVALLVAAWVASALRQLGRDRLAVPLREEKAATYRLFADLWQRRLQQRGAAGEPWPAAWTAELRSLETLLALCGSAALVDAHTRLLALAGPDAAGREALGPVLGDALQLIRKELGAEPLAGAALQAMLDPHAVQPPADTVADTPALAM